MSVIIRLQGLPWTASAGDIRQFFIGLNIPDGGVHIVGGDRGDAFIAFTSDEDARLAMQHNNGYLQDVPVQLFLSSKTEMQNVISEARDGHVPKPVAVAPPRQNIPPMGPRQIVPRNMDNFPQQDGVERGRDSQRRPPNVSPYGSRGPREEQRLPAELGGRGMRGDLRQPPDMVPDMPPGHLRGNRDEPRHALEAVPPGPRGRDGARQPPTVFPPGHRGQREDYKPDFPPGSHRDYGDEQRQQGGLPPRRPIDSLHLRDDMPQGPDDRPGPHQGPPGYRDSHHPQADIPGPGPRGFRDDHRPRPDRHHLPDQRDMRETPPDRFPPEAPYPGSENVRDGQRRPPAQRFDPHAPGLRDFRDEVRLGPNMLSDGREIPSDYIPDRRGPEGQHPRSMRDAPRHLSEGPLSRDARSDGRNILPPGMRPISDDRRSMGDDRRSIGDDRRPMGEDRRSMGEDRRSMGDDRRSMGDDRRPMSDDRRSMGDDRRSVSDDRRPVDDRRLIGDGRQPMDQDRRQLGVDRRPMGDDRRQMGDERRPMGDERRQMGDDRRQMGEGRRPMGNERRPLGDDRRTIGDDRRHPSEPPGLNRRGYRDDDRIHPERTPGGIPPLVGNMREGQMPPPVAPEPRLNDYRDQDRRGPPQSQRFPEDGRPPPDRRRPDMQGPGHRPPPQRERGPPLRNGGHGVAFPQDHDARLTSRYEEGPDRQHLGYAEPYTEKEMQYDDLHQFNDPYQHGQTGPLPDWDARRNMGPPIPTRSQQTGPPPDVPRNRQRDQIGGRPYEQVDNDSVPPPRSNARALLPDPDLPRIDPVAFEERRDELNNRMEIVDHHFDGRFTDDQFGHGYGNEYPVQPEMLEHHPSERGPFPPRGISPSRQIPQRPQVPIGQPPEMYVMVRNMPISVNYSNLRRFFENSLIPRDGIKLLNDNMGQRIGIGFVKFLNLEGYENALRLNGKPMEGRSVNVMPCPQEEFESAVDSYTPSARAVSPKRPYSDRVSSERGAPSPKRRRSNSPPGRKSSQSRKTRYIVLLRDISYRASPQDLKLFFNNLEIVENGILFDQDSSGKPNGIAFVEFKSSRDYNLALQRNRSRFMNRTINISVGDPKDLDRALDKKRIPAGVSNTRTTTTNAQSRDGGDKAKSEVKNEKVAEKVESASPKKESSQKESLQKEASQKEASAPQVNISCFCVRLKGLPPSVTKKDIEDFFKGLDIAPKGYFPVSRKDGSCTGDAFIEFVSPKECQKANAKDQQLMGKHPISVQPVSKAIMTKDLQELRKKAAEENQPPSQPQRQPPLYFMLGAQNLPYSVSIGEILNFFRGYNPVPESIRLHYTNEGRPTGDAVIGFMTESECHRALRDLNSRMLGRRNVRLYLA